MYKCKILHKLKQQYKIKFQILVSSVLLLHGASPATTQQQSQIFLEKWELMISVILVILKIIPHLYFLKDISRKTIKLSFISWVRMSSVFVEFDLRRLYTNIPGVNSSSE